VSCGDWEEEEIQEEDNSSPDPTREYTKRPRSLVYSPDKMIGNTISSFEPINKTASLNIIKLMRVVVTGKRRKCRKKIILLLIQLEKQREHALLFSPQIK